MSKLREYAWLLGAAGGAMVVAFIAFRLSTGTFDATWSAVGGAGAALLMLYLWLDRDDLEAAAASRGARYSAMASLLVAVAAGLAVAINVLADRYDKRWDATTSGLHTLSEQSVQVAEGLERDVEILAFFPSMAPEGQDFRDLVEGYQEHTDRISFRMVDPLKEPLLAQENEVTSSFGTVVLASGEDRQRLDADFDEQALTNALVRLSAGREHTLCFSTGHGERDVDDELTTEGLGALVLKLEGQNYTAKNIVLLRDQVPEDCEVVAVVDPQDELLPPEIEALARYVAGGGALIAMLEPMRADGFAATFSRYGILVGRDIVLEENPSYQLMGGDISWLILTRDSFDFHPVTEGLDGIVLMRAARSVALGEPVEGVKVQLIARTTEQGWGETDISSLFSGLAPTADPATDIVSRVPVMAIAEVEDPSHIEVGSSVLDPAGMPSAGGAPVIEIDGEVLSPGGAAEGAGAAEGDGAAEGAGAADTRREPGGRVVVFGDSDFVANELLVQGNNQDLFMNTVAWLVGEEDQIAIRPNEAGAQTLTLSFAQGFMVWGLSVFLAPFLAVVAAVGAWRKRRRL